jgi:polysaccharide pyruvyl transferase WcaK-like protein
LAYHPKTTDLVTQIGRPEQCLDIGTIELSSLIASLETLNARDTPAERAEIRARVDTARRAVESQFDELLGPLESTGEGQVVSAAAVDPTRPRPSA